MPCSTSRPCQVTCETSHHKKQHEWTKSDPLELCQDLIYSAIHITSPKLPSKTLHKLKNVKLSLSYEHGVPYLSSSNTETCILLNYLVFYTVAILALETLTFKCLQIHLLIGALPNGYAYSFGKLLR